MRPQPDRIHTVSGDETLKSSLARLNDPTHLNDSGERRLIEVFLVWDRFQASIRISMPPGYVPANHLNVQRLKRYERLLDEPRP